MTMSDGARVLALNAGSSSLEFAGFEGIDRKPHGQAEGIGTAPRCDGRGKLDGRVSGLLCSGRRRYRLELRIEMTRRSRRNHSPVFKAKVVLAAALAITRSTWLSLMVRRAPGRGSSSRLSN